MIMCLFILMSLAFHQENRVCWGWTFRGLHGYYTDEVENISFSIIWAFSEYQFYGIIINKDTNTQYTFQHFLMKLIEFRKEKSNIKDKSFWVIYDNASIYKAKSIANFAWHKKICMLTIPPYWPTLNAAEKLILSIKKKIWKYNDGGR